MTGQTSGQFSAPDHAYPCYLTVRLSSATDPTTTIATSSRLDPTTVNLTFRSNPAGLKIAVTSDALNQATPYTQTFVVAHILTVSAPATQTLKSGTYTFQSWSDGGAATHSITAPTAAITYTATYRKR